MVRTLALAALATLFGVSASEAQYRDSYPVDEQFVSEYDTDREYDDGYDDELLGDRGYNEPDIDVGIFASLGHDGRWQLAANFGWVWRPYAAAGWRPYSQGHWVWTSYGWTWVSYEPFGWATYHYGSWANDPMLGWVWIPGYEWAACRVQWAYYDHYISWAPLTPAGYYCPRPWTTAGFNVWFTVGARNFCNPYPARYCETPRYNSVYAERVKYKSPDRYHVERYSGQPVHQAKVNFKHTSWSKGSSKAAKFESKGPSRVTTKSHATRSGTRAFNSPSAGKRNDRVAVKSKSTRQVAREFRAPARSNSGGDRKSISVDRRSSDRRVVAQERQSSRREVAKSKKSSGREGRGKAR